MWNNLIGQHIRRTNRMLLAVNGGMVLVLCAFTLWQGRYLFNFLLGPFPIDRKTLVSVTDPDQTFDYFVTVEGKPIPPAMGRDVEQGSINTRRRSRASGWWPSTWSST